MGLSQRTVRQLLPHLRPSAARYRSSHRGALTELVDRARGPSRSQPKGAHVDAHDCAPRGEVHNACPGRRLRHHRTSWAVSSQAGFKPRGPSTLGLFDPRLTTRRGRFRSIHIGKVTDAQRRPPRPLIPVRASVARTIGAADEQAHRSDLHCPFGLRQALLAFDQAGNDLGPGHHALARRGARPGAYVNRSRSNQLLKQLRVRISRAGPSARPGLDRERRSRLCAATHRVLRVRLGK